MISRFRISLFLCGVLTLFSCQSEEMIREHFQTLIGRDEVTIVVFGDSISGGRGFSESGTSYASYMKPMMQDLLGSRVSMINSCKRDDTFRVAVRRIQEDIFSFRPDVVFVMLGFTDASTRGLTTRIYKEQVGDFLELLQKRNIFVIVLTTTGIRDIQSGGDYGYERIKEFNKITSYTAALN